MNQLYSEFQKSIERIIDVKDKKMKILQKEYGKLPDGSLTLKRTSGKTYFVHNTAERTVSIRDDMDLVYSLARKKYLELRLMEH